MSGSPHSRSLTSLENEPWILPVLIICCILLAPLVLYALHLMFSNIFVAYTEIPYAPRLSKSTSLHMTKPTRVGESFYQYRGYLTVINDGNGWCEYDFKWKYRNLELMVEIRYATEEQRPVNLLINGRLLGTVCERTSMGWGWNDLEREYVTCTYGPFNAVLHDVNTLRLESTANKFPHLRHVRILLTKKKIGMRIPVSIMAHLEEEGDCEFPDGLTAQSRHSSSRRLGGFALFPKLPPGHDVRVKYSVQMQGGISSGKVDQGEFCGNRGSFEYGWRDLLAVRVWLDGADKDRYTIFYRCMVQWAPGASVWCTNGEACPHAENTNPIVSLSVLIEERGAGSLALVDFSRDLEAQHEGFITSNLTSKTIVKGSRGTVGATAEIASEKDKICYRVVTEDVKGSGVKPTQEASSFGICTAMQAKYVEEGRFSPCALGAFSVSPDFPVGHEVSATYSVCMAGGLATGAVNQGEFCGNMYDYSYGWRHLLSIRIWLEGPDSDRYSILYRTLVKGAISVSGWRRDGEPCPHINNKDAIVGISVMVVAAGGMVPPCPEALCAGGDSEWISSVGALACSPTSYGKPKPSKQSNITDTKKMARKVSLRIAPSEQTPTKKEVKTSSSAVKSGVSSSDSQTELVFAARLQYIKSCLKNGVMTKTLGKRNIDALFAGLPYMLPLTLTAYFDIEGERTFVDGALAVSRGGDHPLYAVRFEPVFPRGTQAALKSCTIVRGGLGTSVVTNGQFCGNKTAHMTGWRDLHVIRVWVDGPDKDNFTVFYRSLVRGALVESAWCRDGQECPHRGNKEAIIGLCVIVEERAPLQIPDNDTHEKSEVLSPNGPSQEVAREGVTILPKIRRRGGGAQRGGKHWSGAVPPPAGGKTPEMKRQFEDAKQQLLNGKINRDMYIQRVESLLIAEHEMKL